MFHRLFRADTVRTEYPLTDQLEYQRLLLGEQRTTNYRLFRQCNVLRVDQNQL